MYKGISKFSQRQTRTEASILQNDRPTMVKIKKHKEFKPLRGILRGMEKSTEKLEKLSAHGCPFINQEPKRKSVIEVYDLIKTLDKLGVRHPKAISSQLSKVGIVGKEGNRLTNIEVEKLVSFINKSCRTKRDRK